MEGCPRSRDLGRKANFVLPNIMDFLDEVLVTELQREEADKLVRQGNQPGRRKSALTIMEMVASRVMVMVAVSNVIPTEVFSRGH